MDQNDTTPARGAKGAGAPSGARRRAPKPGASVQMQVQDHIGRQLRAVYDDLLSQPVPDRFLEVLDQLDKGGIALSETETMNGARQTPDEKPSKGSS